MRDIDYEIRVAYMNLLNGFSYKGKPVYAYDEIADEDDKSQFYIVVSGQTSSDESYKCGFSTNNLISFNIIGKYTLGSGTKKDVEAIGNSFLQMALPNVGKSGIIAPSLNIWDSKVITNRTLVDETSNERVITKIITIQHRVNHI